MRRLLAALLLAASLAPAEGHPFVDEMTKGIDLYLKSKYDQALGHFAQARAILPSDWRGHAWQAFTLIEQAKLEGDLARRRALLDEAEAVASSLVGEAGLGFHDPLYLYVTGTIASIRGNHPQAYLQLRKAKSARAERLKPYEEINLRESAARAYAYACMDLAKSLIVRGEFQQADPLAQEAYKIFEELKIRDRAYAILRRDLAVLDEALGRWERAIEHLKACMELYDDEDLKLEFQASMAMIYMQNQQLEKGEEILRRLPPDSKHPEVLVARCMAMYTRATRDPTGGKMDEALAYYRQAMADYPDRNDVYRLVEDYGRLVLEKFTTADPEKERPLLEDLIRRVRHEIEIRPECASLYWLVSEAHKLLGNEKEAEQYARLYEKKKEEYKDKARFDSRGRPRCRTG